MVRSPAQPEMLRDLYFEVVRSAQPGLLLEPHLQDISAWCDGTVPLVLAVGKAAAGMAMALARAPSAAAGRSLVTVVAPTSLELPWDRCLADHPLATDRSVAAATAVLHRIATSPATQPVILAISGGASAAWCLPRGSLALAEVVATNRLLMQAGATVRELNCVRRHLSRIKGGGLALAAAPRPLLTVALVDVVDGGPEDVGSGPAVGDPTTFEQAWALVRRLGVAGRLPSAVRRMLEDGARGQHAETPFPDDPRLAGCRYLPVAAPQTLLDLARHHAPRALTVQIDPGPIARPLHDVAADIAGWLRRAAPGSLRVMAGEPTLELPEAPGRGGRAQHLTLAVAERMAGCERDWNFLAAGSDGRDGPTDAAGALVGHHLCRHMDREVLCRALAAADAYPVLAAHGALLRTGPSGTNLTDLMLACVE